MNIGRWLITRRSLCRAALDLDDTNTEREEEKGQPLKGSQFAAEEEDGECSGS